MMAVGCSGFRRSPSRPPLVRLYVSRRAGRCGALVSRLGSDHCPGDSAAAHAGALFHRLAAETIAVRKLAWGPSHRSDCTAPRDEFTATVTPSMGKGLAARRTAAAYRFPARPEADPETVLPVMVSPSMERTVARRKMPDPLGAAPVNIMSLSRIPVSRTDSAWMAFASPSRTIVLLAIDSCSGMPPLCGSTRIAGPVTP